MNDLGINMWSDLINTGVNIVFISFNEINFTRTIYRKLITIISPYFFRVGKNKLNLS
jgi:hypothetical protein